jgi:hypothetical protein
VAPRWRDLYTWQPGLVDHNLHLVRLYESAPGELPARALCLRHFSRAPLDVEPQEEAARPPCRECLLIVATELARATTVVGMNLASAIVAEAERIGGAE